MNENEIKLSIGLLVYNHGKYLREAIESILMQEVNFKYEIIIGDDKSTDDCRKIILEYKEKYPDKFVVLFHEQNAGGNKTVYDIFMKAKGDYITYFEGDDYWIDKYKLQKQVDFLENNDDYLGVSHILEARDLEGNYISRHPNSSKIVGKDVNTNLFLNGYYFSAVATVFRNIFLDKHTDYSIIYKAHKYVGDFTVCMILLDKGKVKVLNEVMSVYRFRRVQGESNYNSIRTALDQYNDHMQLINALNKYYDGKYNFIKEYLERSMSTFLFCIRYSGFRRFYDIYKTMPKKYKVMFYTLFPFKLFRRVILKIIRLNVKNN